MVGGVATIGIINDGPPMVSVDWSRDEKRPCCIGRRPPALLIPPVGDEFGTSIVVASTVR